MPHGTLTLEAPVGLFGRVKVMLCYRTTVQLSAEVQMNFDLRSEAEMLMQITCVTVNGNTFLYYVISWKVRSTGAFQLFRN